MKVGICAIMKDVYEPYLFEWLDHHRSIGVDYFFLYDNDSKVPLFDMIRGMSRINDIHVAIVSGKTQQINAYEKCLTDIKGEILPQCDRLAFIDEDEFIVCENGDIKKTLEEYTDFPALGITWRVFGSSGLKEKTPEPQRKKFTQHTTGHPYEKHIKSIVDPLRTIGSSGNPHVFLYTAGDCVNVNKEPVDGPFTIPIYQKIWIDHYYTRSMEEWKEKIAKGRSDTIIEGRDFNLINEIDANCSGKKRKVHIIMPFSRFDLQFKLIKAYRGMNVILHPLMLFMEALKKRLDVEIFDEFEWIEQFISMDQIEFNQSALLNAFIESAPIIDDDYYVTANDDDMYEPGVFGAIRAMDDPVVVISMKRGYQIPKDAPEDRRYDPTTLFAYPENMKTGFVGGEQIFMKGSVLKTVHFDEELPGVADGFVAEDLKKRYPIRYEKDLYALFNFYEPGRWERAGLKISFGVLVNDLVRLDMCLRQSQISGQMNFLQGAESATKGLNKLLDTIEKEGADVAALVHQDMSFRQGWIAQVKNQIEKLPESWVVAGVIGKDLQGRVCGKFRDMRMAPIFNTSDIHIFPHPACCFDEAVILVNMKKGFRFDETMDGFDLYGTLCVLQTWEMGGTAWIIDAFCEHHCMRPFTWVPDELFGRNYKWLYDRFKEMERIDSTAIAEIQDERRFETSAA